MLISVDEDAQLPPFHVMEQIDLHGTVEGYQYGCRCPRCVEATSEGVGWQQKMRNRRRPCKSCGNEFEIRVNGAGNVYCSDRCKQAGYNKVHPWVSPRTGYECGHCRVEYRVGARQDIPGGIANRWGLCPVCRDSLRSQKSQLGKHKVPTEKVLQFLADPMCAGCGTDLRERIKDSKTGRDRPNMVVDHDHHCCPGSQSCGKCVRGFLCHLCNTALGYAQNEPDRLRNLADYLERER